MGVTIISSTLRATGNRFHLEDYQIVNGCQTSHVLFDQRANLDDTVLIPLRLIATRDEELIAAIVKATNRQTQVKEEQLLALNDFQKNLEVFFASFEEGRRLFYERRSKQYNTVPGIEKTRIVTLSNLIRAYAALVLEEHIEQLAIFVRSWTPWAPQSSRQTIAWSHTTWQRRRCIDWSTCFATAR